MCHWSSELPYHDVMARGVQWNHKCPNELTQFPAEEAIWKRQAEILASFTLRGVGSHH